MSESHELKPYTLADAIRHATVAAALHHEARHVIEHGGEFHAVEPGELREWLVAGAVLHGTARGGGGAPVYYALRSTAGIIATNGWKINVRQQTGARDWRDGEYVPLRCAGDWWPLRYVARDQLQAGRDCGGWVALDTGQVFLNWRWA